ncbi:MAG TPA: adenylate/guanylate cyclase domain-containing protein [Spongiibacteraceae bacterium]|nr:adenylate/guanylate cyclase domain-containing protein [Spongiibacteraceae bacterium]
MASGVQTSNELIERILAEVQATVPESLSRHSTEQLRKRLGGILEGSGYRSLPSERRALTVVVTELRGFDAIAERHEPSVVVNLFNRYLAQMSDIIVRRGGVIDKLSGDSLIILFGALESQPDHAARALACAAEMQQAMTRCNQQNEILRLPALYMGVGIHSGELVTGAVGAILRREYAALGDATGIAERIAKQSLRGQVLLSDSTFRLVRDFILVGELNSLRIAVRRSPITIYELLGTTRPRPLTVPRREVRKSPRVVVQMPCYFQRVKGSNLLGAMHCGQVVDMGYHGLRMISPVPLDASSEIMMSLSLQLLGNRTSDIYARIVTSDAEQQGYRCSLEFTDIDLVGRQTIKQYVDSQVGAA